MTIVLHPTAFSKLTSKTRRNLIPKKEYNTFKAAISYDTAIKCVDWPYHQRIAPKKHTLLNRAAIDVCRSDALLPVTFVPFLSVEPQMVAEHSEYIDDSLYEITRPYHNPAYLTGSALIRVDMETVLSVNSLAKDGRFVALKHEGNAVSQVEYHISRHNKNEKCIRMSVWEQPHRVKHLNGFLILEIGLLVG